MEVGKWKLGIEVPPPTSGSWKLESRKERAAISQYQGFANLEIPSYLFACFLANRHFHEVSANRHFLFMFVFFEFCVRFLLVWTQDHSSKCALTWDALVSDLAYIGDACSPLRGLKDILQPWIVPSPQSFVSEMRV